MASFQCVEGSSSDYNSVLKEDVALSCQTIGVGFWASSTASTDEQHDRDESQTPFDTTGQQQPPGMKTEIATTLWEDESTLCFQVAAEGICVSRRDDNNMVNGTQLLNVARIPRQTRDSILKGEKKTHLVKVAPAHLEGVWIPLERALEFANKTKITELLYPLFVENIGAFLYRRSSQNGALFPGIRTESPKQSEEKQSLIIKTSNINAQGSVHESHWRELPLTVEPSVNNDFSISATPPTTHLHTPTENSSEEVIEADDGQSFYNPTIFSKIDPGIQGSTPGLWGYPRTYRPARTRVNSFSNSHRNASWGLLSNTRSGSEKRRGKRRKSTTRVTGSNSTMWHLDKHSRPSESIVAMGNDAGIERLLCKESGSLNLTTSRKRSKSDVKPLETTLNNSATEMDKILMNFKVKSEVVGTKMGFETNGRDYNGPFSSEDRDETRRRSNDVFVDMTPGLEHIKLKYSFRSIGEKALPSLESSTGQSPEDIKLSASEEGDRAASPSLAENRTLHLLGKANSTPNELIFQDPSTQSDENSTECGTDGDFSDTDIEINDDDSTSSVYDGICSLISQGQGHCGGTPGQIMSPHLSPMKQALVDRIMDEFWVIFNHDWASNTRSFKGESSDSPSSQRTGSSSDASVSQGGYQKRPRQNDDDSNRDDEGENPPKKPRLFSKAGDQFELIRFACPFRKHNPRKYSTNRYSSCAISHWPTVARVKEHLYRRHRAPIHCSRCWVEFKTQAELEAHSRSTNICDLAELTTPFEGITTEIEKKLRSRKKDSRVQSEADRWRGIYRVLFPDEVVPSPYFDPIPIDGEQSLENRDFANFVEHSRRELPQLVRQALERIVNEKTQPLEESLKNGQLVELIKDCQEQIFSSYKKQFDTIGFGTEPNPPRREVEDVATSLQGTGTRKPDVQQQQGSVPDWESFSFIDPLPEYHQAQSYNSSYLDQFPAYQSPLNVSSESGYQGQVFSSSSASIQTPSVGEDSAKVNISEPEEIQECFEARTLMASDPPNSEPQSGSLLRKDDEPLEWYYFPLSHYRGMA